MTKNLIQASMTATFPERLRTILEETGIRQTDLCDKAGIGKSAMSQYLHGAFIPKQAKLSAIAEALDVSESWLLGYDVPRFRKAFTGSEKAPESYIKIIAQDDSMEEAYIPKGAEVYIKELSKEIESIIEEGDFFNRKIVGLRTDGGRMQLRFLHQDRECIVLTAANPKYAPLIFDEIDVKNGNVQICGIVERVEIIF